MTGTTLSSEKLDPRRRRLLFRSWHRGTREMDLILGRFADAHLETFSDTELDQYERLIGAPDPELLEWVTGVTAPPPGEELEMLGRLRGFRVHKDE